MKFFKHSDILDPQCLDTPEKISEYFPIGSMVKCNVNNAEYIIVGYGDHCCSFSPGRCKCWSNGNYLTIIDNDINSYRDNRDNVCIYSEDRDLLYRRV